MRSCRPGPQEPKGHLLAVAGAFLLREMYGLFPGGLTRLLHLPETILGRAIGDQRTVLMGKAISLWLQRPVLGHGCGSFPLLLGRADAKAHPQNILLEIMAELGLVGLSLFAALNFYAIRLLGPWRRLRSDPWRMLMLMLYVGALVNAMVSGDLHENRALFMALGLLCCTQPTPGLSPLGNGESDSG